MQNIGSDPDYSIWVMASAGTGKTKILTDRVLRLLLEGAEFNKILCLTFTNAAAHEMLTRLSSRLMKWARLENEALQDELESLLLRKPTAQELLRAKDLYEIFLNLPYRIHIYTIHSFCQKILKRFPLEAGVIPSFQIIDEITLPSIINKVRHLLFLTPENQEITEFFTANCHEVVINGILNDIISYKLKFKNYFTYYSQDYSVKIKELKKRKAQITDNLLYSLNNLVEIFEKDPGMLQEDILYGLYDILKNIDSSNLKIEDLHIFFLTKIGDKRSKILPKNLTTRYPNLLELLNIWQENIYQIDQITKRQRTYHYTDLLLKLAQSFLQIYESYKSKHNFLDYDDLIYFTNQLLANNAARDWVLYKLDGGIDHLLIDESQDTSKEQWDIIRNLIEEFYSGQGAQKNNRTIFAVGDDKQSIFSFQGADLEMFYTMREYFEAKLSAAEKRFKIVDLVHSYRSVAPILETVHKIFHHVKTQLPNHFRAENSLITPSRLNDHGRVVLWPLITKAPKSELFWPCAGDHDTELSAARELAVKIASYIKKQLQLQTILPSTKKRIDGGDFLILIRKRDDFTTELIKQLKLHSLETSGLDKLIISENLAVLDLISIAKFVLTPFDDLNLASLLKSPIIGLSDEQIENFMVNKTSSLWERVQQEESISEILSSFINLYHITHTGNFFHYTVDYLGYREILINEGGSESNDAINELLYLSSSFAKDANNSLQDFIYWFEENEMEIKRRSFGDNKIKIMTVHGSKGLEAPIVILCDTTTLPISKNKFIWQESKEVIGTLHSSRASKFFQKIREGQQQKELEEYLRLFYVALTRAADHLIICGHSNQSSLPEYCWYQIAKDVMQNFSTLNEDGELIHEAFALEENFVSNNENSMVSANPEAEENKSLYEDTACISTIGFQNKERAPEHTKVFEERSFRNFGKPIFERWAVYRNEKSALIIPNLLQEIQPTWAISNISINSPLQKQDNLKYGQVFHKVLEDSFKVKQLDKMPEHPLIKNLPSKLQDRMYKAIDRLVVNKELRELLDYEIKTEVNIGLENIGFENIEIKNIEIRRENKLQIGRIDLLAIGKDEVIIIDYKSDIMAGDVTYEIPQKYIDQLALYKQVIERVYNSLNVVCKILWLSSGSFSLIN